MKKPRRYGASVTQTMGLAQLDGSRFDRDELAVTAGVKFYMAVDFRIDGVVSALAREFAWMKLGTALANNNRTSRDELAAVALNA